MPAAGLSLASLLASGLAPARAALRAERADGGSGAASLSSATDRAEIEASLGGDHQAFAKLVRRHQDAVARQMLRFTRDVGQREELVQDVFVEAYGSLGTFRGHGSFAGWLRVLAVRTGYRFWRDRDRDRARRAGPEEALPAAPDLEQPREAAEWLHHVLAKLPPRDRLVLNLLYLDECSVIEAAQLTGWSRSMVKVQAHRARKKLRDLLHAEQHR